MISNLNNFKNQLHNLLISESEKQNLLAELNKIEKEYQKLDFLNRRNTKDKSISINILKETVNELQLRNDYIESINQKLVHHKTILEEQSEQLKQNLHALQLSYKELEHFAFIASHDLKSPLRNIGCYSQLLKKKYYNQLDNTAVEFIDFIVNNTTQMNEIITNLLEYSILDSNKILETTNYNQIIDRVKENLKLEIEENTVVIEVANLPIIPSFRSSIVQLLQNLVQNAIKYRSESNPKIIITAECSNNESEWLFKVCDNGLGLDEQYKEKVFQPFQRIHVKTHTGSGMGLAICRKIVNQHGGDIWYERNKNQSGTTFFFTIPYIKSAESHKNPKKMVVTI
jgi:light-regulated signal transduction histidine kinase (bacteriophytochrome)